MFMLLRRRNTAAPAFAPTDIAGLRLWLKADSLALNDADPVGTWADSSGNANNFTQATAAKKPTYKVNIVNGKPVVRFDGVDDQLDGGDLMNAEAAGEIFVVLKHTADPPTTGAGAVYKFGSSTGAGQADHVPFTDGTIYDGFGSTARKTTVNPADSMASFCLYNVSTAAGAWTNRLNGTQLSTTAVNTVGWHATPRIGGSFDVGDFFFAGDIAEVILYNSVLSSGNRDQVEAYITAKYGITIA